MEKHLDEKLNSDWKETLLAELILKCGIVATGARKRDNPELAERYGKKQKKYQDLMSKGSS